MTSTQVKALLMCRSTCSPKQPASRFFHCCTKNWWSSLEDIYSFWMGSPPGHSTWVVSEPVIFVEMSPTISSWYHSTFCTFSGSFSARDVMFQVTRTSLWCQGLWHLGSLLCWPHRAYIAPVSSAGYGPTAWWLHVVSLCFRRAPRTKAQAQTDAGELPSMVWLQEGALFFSVFKQFFSSAISSLALLWSIQMGLWIVLVPPLGHRVTQTLLSH